MQTEPRTLPVPLATAESAPLRPLSSLPVASALAMINGWSPEMPLPRGLTVAAVSTAITALSEATAPASEQELAVLLAMIAKFGELNRVDENHLKAIMPMYHDDLAGLPIRVAIEAFLRVRRTWKFARCVPLPGDIRAEAEKLMEGWTTARLRLETAARKLRPNQGPARETKAQVEARRADWEAASKRRREDWAAVVAQSLAKRGEEALPKEKARQTDWAAALDAVVNQSLGKRRTETHPQEARR